MLYFTLFVLPLFPDVLKSTFLVALLSHSPWVLLVVTTFVIHKLVVFDLL